MATLVPYTIGSATTVYAQAARAAIGTYWTELVRARIYRGSGVWWTFCINPDAGGPPYREICKMIGTFADPAATSVTTVTVSGVPSEFKYVGCGAVFINPIDGAFEAFCHLERFAGDVPGQFYGSIGIVRSTDLGATWAWVGEVISKELQFDNGSTDNFEVGLGAAVRVGNWIYCYFIESPTGTSDYTNWYTSVARVDADTFFTDLAADDVPTFAKFDGSGWTGDPLTGLAAELPGLDHTEADGYNYYHHDVMMESATGLFLALMADGTDRDGVKSDAFAISTSKDGIHWTTAERLLTDGNKVFTGSLEFSGFNSERSGSGLGNLTWFRDVNSDFTSRSYKAAAFQLVTGSRRTGNSNFKGGPACLVAR